jgi:Mycothiol maleylpyruvate isomerase N-terminal domain
MTIIDAYLSASESAAAMLRDPAVSARWTEPSALAELSVGGLAAHLGRQVLNVPEAFAPPVPDEEPVPLVEHYQRVAWIDSDLDSESNSRMRQGGEQIAQDGPAALSALVDRTLGELRAEFASGADRPLVFVPWAGWVLTLDDFLITRLLELVVHSDDLAVSVGIDTPEFSAEAFEPVIDLLSRIAARRHGQVAVLRALSRSERAPGNISAL